MNLLGGGCQSAMQSSRYHVARANIMMGGHHEVWQHGLCGKRITATYPNKLFHNPVRPPVG